MRKFIFLAGSLIILAAGCRNGGTSRILREQVSSLREQNRQLTDELEQRREENEQLKGQIQTLNNFSVDDPEQIYQLQAVKIGRFTNLYDKNNDNIKEMLIVYFQPLDSEGDIIKAAGSVDVELWDLNKQKQQAFLGKWRLEPDQLRKLWFATLLATNYRLNFDISDIAENIEYPLTVKLTFTDYLTGKVFKEQKVIKPR